VIESDDYVSATDESAVYNVISDESEMTKNLPKLRPIGDQSCTKKYKINHLEDRLT
jgi:hypothetical protein